MLALATAIALLAPAPSDAAKDLIGTLDRSQLQAMRSPFVDDGRRVWQYTPGSRAGLPLSDMNAGQRDKALALVRSTMSPKGFQRVEGIRALEEVIVRSSYDPLFYWTHIFGEPGAESGWAFQFEGHHLALNMTFIEGNLIPTPSFMGGNPANALSKPLEDRKSTALALYHSLTEDQQSSAIQATRVPGDIFTRPGRDDALKAPEGMSCADLTAPQRSALLRVIETYVRDAPDPTADQLMKAIEASIADTRFLWIGDDDLFYYRIHGPEILIEYDHTSDSTVERNHIHSIWRLPGRDYGEDLLGRHHREHRH